MIPRFYFLAEDEQLLVQTISSRYVINGPRVFFKPPFHRVLERRKVEALSRQEYLHVKHSLSGEVHLVEGPGQYFLQAHEETVFHGELRSLARDEFVRIINRMDGRERIVTGEGVFRLEPFEEVDGGVETAPILDACTGVKIRDKNDGRLKLITGEKVFFPKPHEEIVEKVDRVRLEEHEVLVLKDENGRFHFRKGTDEESSFFVPPYWTKHLSYWSSGLNKDKRGLMITGFDLRPKFMWYEFDVRTRDNVELCLKITFFWQVLDVQTLVRTTDDASGDVCAHARSLIIQNISHVDFSEFLARFNDLVREAVIRENDPFYQERGLKIHSVEVREIACKDTRTQEVLSEIIQETTSRINRIQKQESENEVSMKKLEGEIVSEKRQQELQEMRLERLAREARAEGERQALVVGSFLESLDESRFSGDKLKLFEVLRRKEMMEALASKDARIFLTPQDLELKLDMKAD